MFGKPLGVSDKLPANDAMLVLNGLRQVGPISTARLLEAFGGDPAAVLAAERSDLLAVKGIGDKAADTLLHWSEHFDHIRESDLMERSSVQFIDRFASAYPPLLKEIYDPPVGLYVKGRFDPEQPCVAIVGTRRATLYGRSVAKKFASELSRLGYCIVSGMARGTDTAAHEGALEAGGKTIAVCGCGMDIIYPPENLELYRKICATGAVISEFPFGRRADRQTFPMRNRVVSGMSIAVIVIESAPSGGSMITAKFAGEHGRHLLVVPGRIDQVSSGGCHQLIRDGATLVTSVDDILSELNFGPLPRQVEMNLSDSETSIGATADFNPFEQRILDLFRGGETMGVDDIVGQLDASASEVSTSLMGLEIKRIVRKLGDGRFELLP